MTAAWPTAVWGLLPLALVLWAILATRLGTIAFLRESAVARVLGGVTLAFGLVVAGVRLLGALGWLSTGPLLCALASSTLVALLVRTPALQFGVRVAEIVTPVTIGPFLVVGLGLVVVAVAARLLPVWQWDAIGYHLPFVAFALQGRSLSEVPRDALYLSSYPHNVELLFVAWRAMLPDDRLVDLAMAPLGLVGALTTGALSRTAGARVDDACLAALAWLAVPVVYLQLATNYVDVASATFLLLAIYWILQTPTWKTVGCAGVALGLYLGSKPNAPVATALLFGLVAWRARGKKLTLSLSLAAAMVLALGAESYVTNLVEHGNPVWPVSISFGPIVLPGKTTVEGLLAPTDFSYGRWGPPSPP
jgi:hypothetical protein